MSHWVTPHGPSSDLQMKISLLVLGFVAVGALLTIYGYTIAR